MPHLLDNAQQQHRLALSLSPSARADEADSMKWSFSMQSVVALYNHFRVSIVPDTPVPCPSNKSRDCCCKSFGRPRNKNHHNLSPELQTIRLTDAIHERIIPKSRRIYEMFVSWVSTMAPFRVIETASSNQGGPIRESHRGTTHDLH